MQDYEYRKVKSVIIVLYKLDIFIFRPRTFQLCNPVDIRNDNIYVDDLLQGLQSHDTPFKVKLGPKKSSNHAGRL